MFGEEPAGNEPQPASNKIVAAFLPPRDTRAMKEQDAPPATPG